MKNSLTFKFIGTILVFLSFMFNNFTVNAQKVKPNSSSEQLIINSDMGISNEMPVPVEGNSHPPMIIEKIQIIAEKINTLSVDQREMIINQVDMFLHRELIDNSELKSMNKSKLKSVKSIVYGGKDIDKVLLKYSYYELKSAVVALEKTYKSSLIK